jgi:hypothetical protein
VTTPAPISVTQLSVEHKPQDQKPKQEPFQYAEQLKHLEAMGFVDVETNKTLLLKYNGNVLLVVQELLEL